jgi:hypothetical protein
MGIMYKLWVLLGLYLNEGHALNQNVNNMDSYIILKQLHDLDDIVQAENFPSLPHPAVASCLGIWA